MNDYTAMSKGIRPSVPAGAIDGVPEAVEFQVGALMKDLDEVADVARETLAKESVAAHQAVCGCHVVGEDCCERQSKEVLGLEDLMKSSDALDGAGGYWHIDPLCKVRPEAAT